MKIYRRAAALFLSLLMLCQLLPAAALSTGSAEYRAPSPVYSVTFGDQTYLVVAGNTIIEFPEPPVQEGCAFLGWYDGDTLVTAPFTPTKDVRLTAKYEEIKEDTLSRRTLVASADGAIISLTGILPEDCGLTVTDQAAKSRLRMRAAADMMMPLNLYTYDISLTNADGTEYQPEDGPVTVTIRGQKFAEALSTGRSIRLTHYLDDGTMEEITDLQVNADTVTFTVGHFSGFSFTGQYDLVGWNACLDAGGVNVALSGDMPRGAQAAAVSAAPAVDEGAVLAAAEITLLNAGVEVEPASWRSSLTVTMTSGAIARAIEEHSELHVVHIADDGTHTQLDDALLTFTDDGVTFPADQFSVYAVIGDVEPTARMQVNFHIISYNAQNQEVDTLLSTAYVKKNDDDDALTMILFDPGVGTLDEGESFRGWTLTKNYTVEEATALFNNDYVNPYGAMTIEDVRNWAKSKQPGIVEGETMMVYDFYAMVLKHYSVTYEDRFGVVLDTDSAYMLRNENVSQYTINRNYDTNDENYHFKGWITETENLITNPNPAPETVTIAITDPNNPEQSIDKDYKLYTNNTTVKIHGDIVLKAHAPWGNWLIFHEVMKGATYVAPQFLEEGEEPDMPNADNMLLLGYQFDRWYKTYTETTDPDTGEVTSRTYADPFTPGPITEKTNIYAKWIPATWAPYTVIIWKQNLDGTYAYAESVQLYGNVGDTILTTGNTSVNAAGNNVLASINNNDADYLVINGRDKDNNAVTANYRAVHSMSVNNNNATHTYSNPNYVGFNCARIDQGVTINPEGNSVVNVYYDRIEYTIKIYFARSSANTYYVATTRTGNNDNQGLGPGTTDYGMKWTDAITNHQNTDGSWASGYANFIPENVPIYTENSGGYTYYYTTITAKYGANISSEWPRYSWFPNLARSNDPNNNSNAYGFVSWYMENNAAGWQGAGSGKNTFKGIISKMDEKLLGDITTSTGNLLFGRYDGSELYYYTYMIWFDALDGVDYEAQDIQTTTKNGKTYYLKETFIAHSRVSTPTTATQGPTYSGFTLVLSDKPNQAVNHEATCQFYYDRVANPIIYRDGAYYDGNNNYLSAYPARGADQETDPIPFETDITSYNGSYTAEGTLVAGENYKTDYPSSYPGFVFEGWYSDKACTTPYNFTTMPDASITVYAKFRQVQYRVFLHPNVPTGKYVSWGSDDQQMNFRGTYNAYISLPTGKLIANEGTPDVLDDSYEFDGWYLDPQFKRPFDDDAYTMTDGIASAYDKTVDMTDIMNKYGVIEAGSPSPGGTAGPGYNSDRYEYSNGVFTLRDRWWITKKVDLYGKWIKKLEAGTGIQVIYDANGGSFSETETERYFTDTTLYKDGTKSIAQSPPIVVPSVTVNNETKSKVFLYWVLQEWDEQTQTFKDIRPLDFVYPGDQFGVSFANAKTVNTYDPSDPNVITKTEYFVQLRAEYTNPERETPTHIWWYANFGNNAVVKVNDTKTAQNVEEIKINEGVFIKPADTFTRQGYKFLGWARVNSTDEQGNPVSGHPALHPELGENDLFLKYVEASGNVAAHFEAQNQENEWVPVTQVAADEERPYHDLYAVWEPNKFTVTVIKETESGYLPDEYNFDSEVFTFKPTFTGLTDTTDNQYQTNFTLVGDQTSASHTKVFTEVPYGTAFSMAELANEGDAQNYKTSYQVIRTKDSDGNTLNPSQVVASSDINNDAKSYSGTVDGDLTITFTNRHQWGYLKIGKHFDVQQPYLDGVDLEARWQNLTFTILNKDTNEYIKVKPDPHPHYPTLGIYDGSVPSTASPVPTVALSSFQRESGSANEHQYFYYIWVPSGNYRVTEDSDQADHLLPGYERDENDPYYKDATVPANGGIHGNTTSGIGDVARIDNSYKGYKNNSAYLKVQKTVTGNAPTSTTNAKKYTFVVRYDDLSTATSPVYIGGGLGMTTYTTNVNNANSFTLQPGGAIQLNGQPLNDNGTIRVLAGGHFTVIELDTTTSPAAVEDPVIPNYTWTQDGPKSVNPVAANVSTDPALVTITNNYTLLTVPMTLDKVVTGNMGNQNEQFTFTIAVFEDEASARAGTNPRTPPEQDGWLSSVTRTGAQEAVSIGQFPVGAWVKITESANAEKYDTIKAKVGTGQDTDVSSSREYIFRVPEPAAGQTEIPVVFTNDWNLIIPTGVAQDRTPYLALLALALLGAAMLVRRRRKA